MKGSSRRSEPRHTSSTDPEAAAVSLQLTHSRPATARTRRNPLVLVTMDHHPTARRPRANLSCRRHPAEAPPARRCRSRSSSRLTAAISAAVLLGLSRRADGAHEELSPLLHRTSTISRFLQSDRTSAVDPSTLICQLGASSLGYESPEIDSVVIPYYYAAGTDNRNGNTEMDPVEQFNLEQLLYKSIAQDIPWCYSYKEPSEARRQETEEADSGRKMRGRSLILSPASAHPPSEEQRGREGLGRRLSILSVAAGPTEGNVGECPDSRRIQELTAKYNATGCTVYRGSIVVRAHRSDNLEYLTAALWDVLEATLNRYEVWQEWTEVSIPDLAFLWYVGDTYEDVYGGSVNTDDPIIKFNVTNSTWNETGGGGSRGVFGDNTAGALVLLLGVGLPVAAALILFAVVVQKKRRATMTAKDFGLMNSEFVLVGTGDPPGSFHEGLYHYMLDGTRYLSTNCEGCLETRRNSFYTDNNLGSIPEDREYEEDILITADSKDLGGKTATMDVHRCSSATCKRCVHGDSAKRVFFIPSMRMMHSPEIYTIPEHAEV